MIIDSSQGARLDEFLSCFDEEKKRRKGMIAPGVYRGKCPVLSSFLEDLFAVYLTKVLDNESLIVLVDASMKVGKVSCRPDIIVAEKQGDGLTIQGFVDCKTSLGWNRNGIHDMARKYQALRELVQNGGLIVRIGGVEAGQDDVRLNGFHEVKPDFVWDVFVKDVWGRGSEQSVLEQIESWNRSGESEMTRIWWGQSWPMKGKGVYKRYDDDIFVQIKQRILLGAPTC